MVRAKKKMKSLTKNPNHKNSNRQDKTKKLPTQQRKDFHSPPEFINTPTGDFSIDSLLTLPSFSKTRRIVHKVDEFLNNFKKQNIDKPQHIPGQ